MQAIVFLNVVWPATTISAQRCLTFLIAKANVAFVLFAPLLPSLLFLDVATAKMESRLVSKLAIVEKKSAQLVPKAAS